MESAPKMHLQVKSPVEHTDIALYNILKKEVNKGPMIGCF